MNKKDFTRNLATKDNPRTLTASTAEKAKAPKATVSKTKGRPLQNESRGKKRDYCKIINIAVPQEVIDEVNEIATKAREINLTEYINQIINEDLEKNRDSYKQYLEFKKNYKKDFGK